MANGKVSGFLGHHNRDRVGFFSDTETGSMPQSKGAVQVFALAYGKNTSRGNQTVIPNDDPSIVQRRFREKRS